MNKLISVYPAIKAVVYISFVSVLTSCGALPHYSNSAVINVPAIKGWRVPQAEFPSRGPNIVCSSDDQDCLHPVFIGVAISGGGSRAANFGLGALAQLVNLGLADSVTAFSSVSGGSLAAAAYVSNPFRSNGEFEQIAAELRTDLLVEWLLASSNPTKILSTLFTSDNATHTLGDVFDDRIFHGKTFGELDEKKGTKLYINASLVNKVDTTRDLTTRGNNSPLSSIQGFTFSTTAFEAMSSDLSKVRLADAVAASGAYPGLFEPMALRDFSSVTYRDANRHPLFLHLIDGGASDNLGTDALVRAYANQMRFNPQTSCLLILVDAHVSDYGDIRSYVQDLRTSPMDYIVSGSLSRSFDLLLDRRREDQLNAFGIQIANADPRRFKEDVQIALGNDQFSSNGWSSVKSNMRDNALIWRVPGGRQYTHATCAIWHIPLDGLLSLTELKSNTSRYVHLQYYNDSDESLRDKSLNDLDYFVNAIETNYKLGMSGAGRCSAHQIQSSLFEAAYQLIRSDSESLKALEEWFKKQQREDIATGLSRRAEIDLRPEVRVPRYHIRPASFASPLTTSVECDDDLLYGGPVLK